MKKYERLTISAIRLDDDSRAKEFYICGVTIYDLYNRLAELEDKIENGTLIELHCKVGDKVYQFDNGGKICESEIKSIYYADNTLFYDCGYFAFDNTAIGEGIYLTKAEAENKLKELKGEV
jgi:hypothetical protein